LAELFDDLPSLEHVEASASAFGKSAFAKWEHEDFRETYDRQMAQAHELRDSLYLQLATREADRNRRAKVSDILGVSGFAALFPERKDLDELALLSLHFGGPGAPIHLVAQKLQRAAKELSARLLAFNSVAQNTLGLDLFELEEDVATAAL
jgi:hypothetical protein